MTDGVQAVTLSNASEPAQEPARREADDLPAAGILRLAIGLLQGLALYLLERQREKHGWPATAPYLFVSLASIALLVPVFVLQAAGRMSRTALVIWSVIATALVAGLGWYDVYRQAPDLLTASAGAPTFPFLLFAFAGLFITQSLIAAGDADASFLTRYRNYFDSTWKFGVQLALAAAFVGAFWAMLWLGAALFDLIKLTFPRELIQHSWFSIPATTLAVAAAIHLTDVRAQLVVGIRSVGLTLLSWLLPLMTILAAAFVISLGFTGLDPLWKTREAVAILLVAAAVLVVLINAAYQDGEDTGARPLALRYAELIASVLLVPLVALSAYALALRVQQHGWTVDRIATLACILVASCYALGYTAAALFSLLGGQWMWALESVNIFVAFLILAVLAALFTPVADPARLSVLSQIARLETGTTKPSKFDFAYLRFQGGRFGEAALRSLAAKQGKGSAFVRAAASDALSLPKVGFITEPGRRRLPPGLAARITIYPRGTQLPLSFVSNDWDADPSSSQDPLCVTSTNFHCDAFVVDFRGDGHTDLMLFSEGDQSFEGVVFEQVTSGSWRVIGTLDLPVKCQVVLRNALRAGNFASVDQNPKIRDLSVAGMRVRTKTALMMADDPVTCPPERAPSQTEGHR